MTASQTHDRRKIPGICGSTAMPDMAYKLSWGEKVRATIPDWLKSTPASGEAFAAEHVSDLRPLRGALRASLTSFLASAGSHLWELTLPSF
jgi:hypothetical protein